MHHEVFQNDALNQYLPRGPEHCGRKGEVLLPMQCESEPILGSELGPWGCRKPFRGAWRAGEFLADPPLTTHLQCDRYIYDFALDLLPQTCLFDAMAIPKLQEVVRATFALDGGSSCLYITDETG